METVHLVEMVDAGSISVGNRYYLLVGLLSLGQLLFIKRGGVSNSDMCMH